MKFTILFSTLMVGTMATGQVSWTYEMAENATRNVPNGISEYTASDGSVWTVGQEFTIGSASGIHSFKYITVGSGVMTEITQLEATMAGTKATVKKLRISGTKRTGRRMWLTTTGMFPNNIQLENAISYGEVVTSGYTSDKALEELKKAKDKLDLGLITQEEFDSLRTELAKYID